MGELVHETEQEFWRPPSPAITGEVVVQEAIPAMAETCPRCGAEFLLGSGFCHSCGRRRPKAESAAAQADAAAIAKLWERTIGQIRSRLIGIPWRGTWNRMRSMIGRPTWLSRVHFPDLYFGEIRHWLGLPTASLIAFLIGLGCVAGALLVGLFTANTLVDWQAIQFYRVEWLLAATASFVAGILLRKSSDN